MNEDIVDAVTADPSGDDVSGRAARRARRWCVGAGVVFTAVHAVVTVASMDVPVAVDTVLLAGAVTGFVAAVTIGKLDADASPF